MGTRKPREKIECDGVRLGRRGSDWVADYGDAGARKRVRLFPDATRQPSKADATAALRAFATARRSVETSRKALKIADLWKLWLADRAEDGRTCDIHAARWVSLGPVFGHLDPDALTVADCRQYASRRFALGRAAWTVHTEIMLIRGCLQWSKQRKLIASVPYVWVPSKGKNRSTVLSVEDARLLLDAAGQGDPHVYLFVVLAMTTGARHGAILDLTWDRVDFERGVIDYHDKTELDPMSKAWRKKRATVPMGRTARRVLEIAHRGRRSEHVVEHGGKRLKSIREGFRNAVERAGLAPSITPHVLRHTVATWTRDRSHDFEQVAQLLGHADSHTTRLIYDHAQPHRIASIVDAIDDAIQPALPEGGRQQRRFDTQR